MWRELLGLDKKPAALLDLSQPRRGFADVVLPVETRRQLSDALTQIQKHRLIFHQWGLGERHPTALGLVFNFAGPPGTGKTICAEAVAHALGRKLLRVRYAELESCWAGETGKNIRSVFREARTQDAVLFFDEADSIASRRFSNVQAGYEREANQAVNILLKELEEYEGVVIFATNMAANFDPAFERRIRTHILFRLPGVEERERIWKIQFHPHKTPLGANVDLKDLARRYETSGGDIRNAVIKAAQMAAAEEGPDETKRILQRHLERAAEEVIAARRVMQQNALDVTEPNGWSSPMDQSLRRLDGLERDLETCRTELEQINAEQQRIIQQAAEAETRLTGLAESLSQRVEDEITPVREAIAVQETRLAESTGRLSDRIDQLLQTLESVRAAVASATLLPIPRRVAAPVAALFAIVLLGAGAAVGRLFWGG